MEDDVVILQDIWAAGDSLITQLEMNKDKRLRFFGNDDATSFTDADGDTWDYPIAVIFPEGVNNFSRLEGGHRFFFIDTMETHNIEHVAGQVPEKGLDSVYKQFTGRTTRILYCINKYDSVEKIIEFDKDSNIRLEGDKPSWLHKN